MSNDNHIFTLKDSCNKENTDKPASEEGPSNFSLVNGFKSLNVGVADNKTFVLPETKSGFTLNDLAKTHLNQATIDGSNTILRNDGLNIKLDFNNLNIGPPKGPAISTSNTTSVSSLSTSTPPAILSISSLAKEHECSINKLQKQTIATTSGFKIPSLFGDASSSATSGIPKSQTLLNKPNIPRQTIDLSSALLSKDERPSKYLSIEEDKVASIQTNNYKNNTVSSKQLIASIDLLIPNDSVDINIQFQKKSPSSFGQVLCRQWKANKKKRENIFVGTESHVKKDLSANSKRVKPFMFDVPSPDEIIIAAQSKVFGRTQ